MNIEDLVKQAVMDNFDIDNFISNLSEDIYNNNPEWWAEQIVKPLKNELKKVINEKENLIKAILYEMLETEFPHRKIENILEEEAKTYIKSLMPRITIKVEKK